MNLLENSWIPVHRQSGIREKIVPWQLTDAVDSDPIVALDFPRPDFNGSVMQFLIGLFQTASAPKDDKKWESAYLNPPSPEQLEGQCRPYGHAFNFDGNGPRFLQDLQLEGQTEKPISGLLIEEPGANTLRENRDLFVRRDQFPALGMSAAIAALITLQTNAPSGGAGHRTSMRGGGPLTTLVVPDPVHEELPVNLWRVVWLNVLDAKSFDSLTGNHALKGDEAIFPWLAPTRTSEAKTGVETTPEDAHTLQMYWGMPRRIRLDLEVLEHGRCPMTLEESPLVEIYQTKNYGINYAGAWEHPLSPHQRNKEGLPLPRHPQPGGIGYRHWLALTLGTGGGARPAPVVQAINRSRRRARRRTRIWAFGYDMDNMKARGWYDAVMPLYHVDEQVREDFAYHVEGLLEAAEQVARNLRDSLKKAWFSPAATVRGDLSFVVDTFWGNTEPDFFSLLERVHSQINNGKPILNFASWLNTLNAKAVELFDTWVSASSIEYEDPKQVATARNDLIKFNHSRKLKNRLGIPDRAA